MRFVKSQMGGFIGFGNVGGKLAGSLVCNPWDIVQRGLNRDAAAAFLDAGRKWVDRPKEIAQLGNIIITYLPSPVESAEVLEAEDGVLIGRQRIKPGRKYGSCDINFMMDLLWKESELF